jgi:predicted SAM-dependent methyltransferase
MIFESKRLVREKFPFVLIAYRAGVAFFKHQRSRRHIKRLLKQRSEIFLEIGAGDKKGEGSWLTIDITKNCDIFFDMRKGLPFPDQSITKIYSSHFFEHLSCKEILSFLDECIRVLVPGGAFSICVPNAKLYIESYLRSISLDEDQFFSYKPAYNNMTGIDYVNYIAYMDGEHKHMFDEENLLCLLASKGFRNVRLRQFDPSLDLSKRDSLSIYAEAEK